MTDDELKRLEDLANAATSGPWLAIENESIGSSNVSRIVPLAAIERRATQNCSARPDYIATGYNDQDAAFIAAAREAVPALLAEVERLREAVAGAAAMREILERTVAQHNSIEDGPPFLHSVKISEARKALSSSAGAELLAEVERLRLVAQVAGDGVAQVDAWRNAIEADRDALKADYKVLSEVRQPGTCQCSDDEACQFVRQRDALETQRDQAQEWLDKFQGTTADQAVELFRAQARITKLEAVAEAAREWLKHLEDNKGRFLDGIPGDLMDKLAALEKKP